MVEIDGDDALRALAGRDLGVSAWHRVTQERIALFAEATDDDEPIHLDGDHARAMGLPGTIGHGLFTLSLGPKMLYELWTVRNVGLGLNYGFERVRFLQPVPEGGRVRMRARVTAVTDTDAGMRVAIEQTFELEGSDRPACVADAVVLFRGAAAPPLTTT
ncbi:MaoC family dehydratase [Patulibacter minatonensis]|uniref:MaoC family dehydratase n=1 Tax=Patulibacter minatonensis TaxID=298163 RepID=UPI00047BBA6B|nr:MaoC family dehydratase [Patulibacter minatonensis]